MPSRRLDAIDAHVAGQVVRLIINGLPPIQGTTLGEQQDWASKRLRGIRETLIHEPRGHRDLLGALLTPPSSETAQAGVLFMHHDGWPAISLHGLMAVATIALERGLITLPDDAATLTFDTVRGPVALRAERSRRRVRRVAVRGLPSFVLFPAAPIRLQGRLPGRVLKVDIAYGGEFFAIVDGEAAGLPFVRERLPELRALTRQIANAAMQQHAIVHPQDASITGLAGVIFTGPARSDTSDLRGVVVYAGGGVDRSPGGEAMAAVMAVVDAMLPLSDDRPFRQEGPIGTRFRGRVLERLMIEPFPAIVPGIEGRAWIIGEHTFIVRRDDPLAHGFSF
jgi:proline racemase